MNTRLLRLALLGAALLGAPAQAATDTDYSITFATLQGSQLHLLISEETVRSTCYWGRHSCKQKPLGAKLYRLVLPVESRWIGFAEARRKWQKIREAPRAESFWGNELAGDALILFDQEGAAVCPLSAQPSTCSAAQDIPAPLQQRRPARHDPRLLANDKVYRLPSAQVEHDLHGREGYRQFREAISRDMRHDGQSAQLVGPVGARYLVGMEQYAAAGESPLLAQLYDIADDSTRAVRLKGLPADVTVSSLDVVSKDDDVLFLLNLFRYSKDSHELEYTQDIIYSARNNDWIKITAIERPLPRHLLWDADHARFIQVQWNHQRDGIEIIPRAY